MRRFIYLSTCDTCKRIRASLALDDASFVFQDIKSEPLTEEQLDEILNLGFSYSELFNKRARKYRTLDRKIEQMSDMEVKELLLSHYTYLRRPIIQIGDTVFVGNAKKTILQAKEVLDGIR